MQRPRSAYLSDCGLLVLPLALVILLLTSACAPGAATTLSGVGCPDPFCNEVDPETRKVLGCIGAACNPPPPPSPVKQQAATEASSRAPQTAAEAGTGARVPSLAEADADESEEWNIKVYYESHDRQ